MGCYTLSSVICAGVIGQSWCTDTCRGLTVRTAAAVAQSELSADDLRCPLGEPVVTDGAPHTAVLDLEPAARVRRRCSAEPHCARSGDTAVHGKVFRF